MKKIKVLFLALFTLAITLAASACGLSDKIKEWQCEKHDYGGAATKVLKEATCTQEGEEVWTCRLCGKEEKKAVDKLAHDYDEGVVTKEATCAEKGEKRVTCGSCGETKLTEVAKLPHNRVDVEGKSATCTEDGYLAYAYCADCNVVIVPKVGVPTPGHKEVVDAYVAPTCTEEGLSAGKHCAVCGEETKEQVAIPATGHRVVVDDAVVETCTTDGLTQGSHCSVCNYVIDEQVVIKALGHVLGEDKTCDVCGYHEHTLVEIPEVAATCTAEGSAGGKKCSECLLVVEVPGVIPMLGHTFGEDWTCTTCGAEHNHEVVELALVAPTCTEDGLTTGSKCGVCGKSILAQQVIPAKGHVEVEVPAVAATCTEDGSTAGKKCSRCNEISEGLEVVPATGHTYNDFMECTVCAAEYVTPGLLYELNEDGTGAVIVGCNPSVLLGQSELAIVTPRAALGKPVTAIASEAFADMDKDGYKLMKLVLRGGDSVDTPLTIGNAAFFDNDYLETIVMTGVVVFDYAVVNGVKEQAQFGFCDKLTEIVLDGRNGAGDCYWGYEDGVEDECGPWYGAGYINFSSPTVRVRVVGDLPKISYNFFRGFNEGELEIVLDRNAAQNAEILAWWKNYKAYFKYAA